MYVLDPRIRLKGRPVLDGHPSRCSLRGQPGGGSLEYACGTSHRVEMPGLRLAYEDTLSEEGTQWRVFLERVDIPVRGAACGAIKE